MRMKRAKAGLPAPSADSGARGVAARERTDPLSHELARVLHPRPAVVQRQMVPFELLRPMNHSLATEAELTARHAAIIRTLQSFNRSTLQTAQWENEAAGILMELARRAMATGRTFSPQAIATMRAYFVENAKTEQDACIVALNKGLKLATGQADLPTTPETIEKSMGRITATGQSVRVAELWFLGRNGRITRGAARPERLNGNIFDSVVAAAGGDVGWSVFTMSLLDGYHSITLTLDNSDPARPRVYWSDQWQSKQGWLEYNASTLNEEAVKLVQGWWDKQEVGKKHTTVARLWRVYADPRN